MPIDNELIDNLLKDYKTPEEILGDNGLLKQFTKAVLERALRADRPPRLRTPRCGGRELRQLPVITLILILYYQK